MKKMIKLLCIVAMTVSLAACGGQSDTIIDMYIHDIDAQNWASREDVTEEGIIENEAVDECNRLLKEKGYSFQVVFHYRENIYDNTQSSFYQNLLLENYAESYADTDADIVPVFRTDEEYCLNMDSYLEEHEDFYRSLPEIGWLSCMQNGSVYAVPHSHNYIEQNVYVVRDELAFSVGADYAEIFAKIKETDRKTGSVYLPIYSSSLNYFDFDHGDRYLLHHNFPCILVDYDDAWKITPFYDDADVVSFYESAQQMIEEGYTERGLSEEEALTKQTNGSLLETMIVYPGFESDSGQEEYHSVPFQNIQLSAGVSYAIMKDSEHPDEAFTFLELLNTDQDMIDLFLYGIEGKDYKVEDGMVTGMREGWIAPSENGTPSFVNPRRATAYPGLEEAFQKQDEQYKTLKIDAIQFALHALDIRGFSRLLDNFESGMLFQLPTTPDDPLDYSMEGLKESLDKTEIREELSRLEGVLNESVQKYDELLKQFYE